MSTTVGNRTDTGRYPAGQPVGMPFADTTQVSDSVNRPLLPNRDPGYGALQQSPSPFGRYV